MPRNHKRDQGKGDLHFIILNCDQKKKVEKDPPFQQPKRTGWAFRTATRKDKIEIVLATLGCPTSLTCSTHTYRPAASSNSRSQISLSSLRPVQSVRLSRDKRLVRRTYFPRQPCGPAPVHFVDVHPALSPLGVLEHQ